MCKNQEIKRNLLDEWLTPSLKLLFAIYRTWYIGGENKFNARTTTLLEPNENFM